MRYLSTQDAAKLFGVSDRTVRNWCASGALQARKFGKLWRVMVDDEKERPAVFVADAAGHESEVLLDSTVRGDFTWKD